MSVKKKAAVKRAIKKISKAIRKPRNIMHPEVFIDNDIVLPTMELSAPVAITVRINAEKVELVIGSRDWMWDRRTKKLIGTGTLLAETQPESVVEDGEADAGDFDSQTMAGNPEVDE